MLFKKKSYLLSLLTLMVAVVLSWLIWQKGSEFSVLKNGNNPERVLQDKGFYLYDPTLQLPQMSFTDLKGQNRSLNDLKGSYRLLLVNIWQTTCHPCLEEIPQLDRLASEFDQLGLKVLFINYGEELNAQQAFLDKYPYDLDFWADLQLSSTALNKTLPEARAFAVLPQTYLVDADGFLIGALLGATNWQADDLKDSILSLL